MKKLLISFLTSLIVLLSFAPYFPAYAAAPTPTPTTTVTQPQGTWYNQSFKDWFSKVNDSPSNEIFGERYTAAQVQWVIYGLFYFIINGGGGNNEVLSCLTKNDIADCVDPINNLLRFKPTSAQPPKSMLAFFLEDRQLSGITYLKQTARNLHLIPEAKAQTPGFGFTALDPVLGLWRASRNIAYIFFVIIIVAMAFMIMFRVKISPQVVITVQSALPKVAISLILITFSYAIAGFMVDLMYVFIGLISVVLASSGALLSASPTSLFNFLTQGATTIAGVSIPLGIFGLLIGYTFWLLVALFMVFLAGNGLIGAIITTGAFALSLPWFGGIYEFLAILAIIVLLFIFLIAAFKIVWMFIKTLANIFLLTIFAPFQIALGAITGATGFGAWLKSFLSNLAVFPVTGFLMALSWIFLIYAFKFMIGNLITLPGSWGDVFNQIPALAVLNGWPPMLGAGNKITALIFVGTSLSIMMMLPKVVELIQSFMSGKPFAYGTAIGEAVGPVIGIPGKVVGGIQTAGGLAKSITSIREAIKLRGGPQALSKTPPPAPVEPRPPAGR